MILYKNQLSTLEFFTDFLRDYKQNLTYNAMKALFEYEKTVHVDFDDYVVFFIGYDENNEEIFAVSKIIDHWEPVEINDRVRKFTSKRVFPNDSHGHIKFD